MSEGRELWVPLYPFAVLALWSVGVWFLATEVGVGPEDVVQSTRMAMGVMAILTGQILMFMGTKAEIAAAREGREWWIDGEGPGGSD